MFPQMDDDFGGEEADSDEEEMDEDGDSDDDDDDNDDEVPNYSKHTCFTQNSILIVCYKYTKVILKNITGTMNIIT